MTKLYMSSCLFATIVVHAYYCNVDSYHHAFLSLTVSSILYHTTHDEITRRIDKLLAHICFIMVMMDTPKALAGPQWLLCFPYLTVCTWYSQSFLPSRKHELHLCLHLIAVLGMHVYLWVLYWLHQGLLNDEISKFTRIHCFIRAPTFQALLKLWFVFLSSFFVQLHESDTHTQLMDHFHFCFYPFL